MAFGLIQIPSKNVIKFACWRAIKNDQRTKKIGADATQTGKKKRTSQEAPPSSQTGLCTTGEETHTNKLTKEKEEISSLVTNIGQQKDRRPQAQSESAQRTSAPAIQMTASEASEKSTTVALKTKHNPTLLYFKGCRRFQNKKQKPKSKRTKIGGIKKKTDEDVLSRATEAGHNQILQRVVSTSRKPWGLGSSEMTLPTSFSNEVQRVPGKP